MRFKVDPTRYRITTLSGILLDPNATLISMGVGTLFHTWELVLSQKPAPVTHGTFTSTSSSSANGAPEPPVSLMLQ